MKPRLTRAQKATIFGGITFRYTNGSPGGFGTIGNHFNIFVQAPDGAEPFAFFGQHCGDHYPITSAGVDSGMTT